MSYGFISWSEDLFFHTEVIGFLPPKVQRIHQQQKLNNRVKSARVINAWVIGSIIERKS